MDYINGRSMEQLRRLGLANAVREIGVDPDGEVRQHLVGACLDRVLDAEGPQLLLGSRQ